MDKKRYIISGGGTGGHIFPAISIARAIKRHDPTAEILFVGAHNRMEMEKVPAAGFKIVGLPIAGLQRGSIGKNLTFLPKLFVSLHKGTLSPAARRSLRTSNPRRPAADRSIPIAG